MLSVGVELGQLVCSRIHSTASPRSDCIGHTVSLTRTRVNSPSPLSRSSTAAVESRAYQCARYLICSHFDFQRALRPCIRRYNILSRTCAVAHVALRERGGPRLLATRSSKRRNLTLPFALYVICHSLEGEDIGSHGDPGDVSSLPICLKRFCFPMTAECADQCAALDDSPEVQRFRGSTRPDWALPPTGLEGLKSTVETLH
jgi:hypothetical protein